MDLWETAGRLHNGNLIFAFLHSKPIFRHRGLVYPEGPSSRLHRYCTHHGCWGLIPSYLGTWTLWERVEAQVATKYTSRGKNLIESTCDSMQTPQVPVPPLCGEPLSGPEGPTIWVLGGWGQR